MQVTQEKQPTWLDRPIISSLTLNWETLIFTVILILAIFSRFYDLESRVMSHDENSHVYYSWRLSEGDGYQHTPLTHGPLLFHLTAFSYFLFGDNDFTARIPFALSGIATIWFLWYYRRYLGRVGTIVAAGLMLISPYMLYYSRYVRNEALVGLLGVITLWSILRYFDTGEAKYTYWLIASTALHFTTKETSFIYTAQALIFLGLVFVYQILRNQRWEIKNYRRAFIIFVITAFAFLAIGGGIGMISGNSEPLPVENAEIQPDNISILTTLPIALCGLSLLLALYFAIRGLTWEVLRNDRAFSLIILLMTMVLPHLVAFPVRMVGWDPMEYETWEGILRIAAFLVPLILISIAVGLVWNRKLWLINAAIFYIPFILLFTTIFTNGQGFFTGLVGSLGYWIEQQGVQRGSQPWYYYAFLQIPVYEFLPAVGCLLAGYLAFFKKRVTGTHPREVSSETQITTQITGMKLVPGLLGFWILTSIIAYSIAGEKMPWLTFHIALPMILLSGWAIGQIIEKIDWKNFKQNNGFLLISLMIILLISLSTVMGSILGPNRPFQGRELSQLSMTYTFFTALIVTIASGWGVMKLVNIWDIDQIGRLGLLTVLSFLAIITARSAFRAAYINYDNATEYMVYAHSASGPKKALAQIQELSERTTDGLAMVVAYDDETTYPYWWYLRNYPNAKFYGANPTRELREAPVILVGDKNFAKIEPVVGQAYHRFDYIRIWWPDQDYYNMTWERIKSTLSNPDMRAAIFQIWYNRDYTKYAELKGKDMSLPNWEPSDRMRLYVRKDIASQVWNYGVSPTISEELLADPYEGKEISFPAEFTFGVQGDDPGEFNMPRSMAISSDGTLFISDTGNHRIQHLTENGDVINTWGYFADQSVGDAPPGTFYEPWGVAVSSDDSVFVADTWNHRIQKFTSDGKFITQWGYFGQGESGDAFWGPRDIVIDSLGNVLVTDTGNKRIAIFDQDGNFKFEFGSAGLLEGQFDEPVGLAIDPEGRILVADTWNQRVQVFEPDYSTSKFSHVLEWDIVGWYGQSLDNKPFLAVDSGGNVYIADPEGYRILQFNSEGEFIQFWGDYSTNLDGFNLPTGITVGKDDKLWVVDAGNHRILRFPEAPASKESPDP
jgi:predicted membrane-bound mannosyltransferase/DNA-binding beta-propeller fold protein YncE